MCVLSCLSHVRLFATPWTAVSQAPPSMGFSRQEYWSGLPCLPPWDLPDPGIEPVSLASPALAGRFFTINTTWETSQSGVGQFTPGAQLSILQPGMCRQWGREPGRQEERGSGWSISFEIRQTSFLFQFWGCLTGSTLFTIYISVRVV